MTAGRVYRIRQQVTKTGHQSNAIRFVVRKDGGDPVPLAMDVTYDGDADSVISEPKEKGAER